MLACSMGDYYLGTVIKESLEDPSILDELDVLQEYIEEHPNEEFEEWHLCEIHIEPENMDSITQRLQSALRSGWFTHFYREDKLIVVFKDKIFHASRRDLSSQQEAIEHGLNQGIPKEQLDFKEL